MCEGPHVLYSHMESVVRASRKSGRWLKRAEMNKMQFIEFELCYTSWSSVLAHTTFIRFLSFLFFFFIFNQMLLNQKYFHSKRLIDSSLLGSCPSYFYNLLTILCVCFFCAWIAKNEFLRHSESKVDSYVFIFYNWRT